MTENQRKYVLDLIRVWANPDEITPYSEGPLAARHRFTEAATRQRDNHSVKATASRNSGGSRPVTFERNVAEESAMRHLMMRIEEYDLGLPQILKDWGRGMTFVEIGAKREYSDTRAKQRFEIGLNLVCFGLQENQGNRYRLGR